MTIIPTKALTFTDEMAQAVRAGRKTQMRVPLEPQPVGIREADWEDAWEWSAGPGKSAWFNSALHATDLLSKWCPYGSIGTRHIIRRAGSRDALPGQPYWRREFIEIRNIRVAQLFDISEADARAEGIDELSFEKRGEIWISSMLLPSTRWDEETDDPCRAFRWHYASIYGAESMESNQWVWVIEW